MSRSPLEPGVWVIVAGQGDLLHKDRRREALVGLLTPLKRLCPDVRLMWLRTSDGRLFEHRDPRLCSQLRQSSEPT